MEFNFTFAVIASRVGMIARIYVGLDPWRFLGSVALMATLLPLAFKLLGTGLESDSRATEQAVASAIEATIAAVPSILVGELAGYCAGFILGTVKRVVGIR